MTTDIKPFTPEDMDHISDSRLKDALLVKANVEFIEDLLVELEKKYFKSLGGLWSDTPDLGEPIKLNKIEEIFIEEVFMEDVKGEVDSFLNVSPVGIPLWAIEDKLDCPASYYPTQIRASIRKGEKRKNIPSHIAHEYTHHIQNKFKTPNGKDVRYNHKIFSEGHAGGTERNFANAYAQAKNDIEFSRQVWSTLLFGMRRTYVWMYNRWPWFKMKNLVSPSEIHTPATKHDLGTTLFYMAEKRYGPRIYADVLRGKFGLLYPWRFW